MNLTDDLCKYVLNTMLDYGSKHNFYLINKRFSTLIPHTFTNAYSYSGYDKSMPNIFKHTNSHTFKIETLCIVQNTDIPLNVELSTHIKKIIYMCNNPFPDLSNNVHIEKLIFTNASTFNYPLNNLLPRCLKVLELNKSFNIKLNSGDLPKTLEELTFLNYDHELYPNILPLSLKKLYIQNYNYKITKDFFPPNLENLRIYYNNYINETYFPTKLKSLHLVGHFDYNIYVDIAQLPRTLESLKIYRYNIKQLVSNSLPPKLKEIELSVYNYPLNKLLFPSTMESIDLSKWDDHFITQDTFPNHLKQLGLHFIYKYCIIPNSLPEKLEELRIQNYWYKLEKNTLPSNLKLLQFEDAYNYPIPEKVLPPTLERIHLGYDYNHSISNVFTHCCKLKMLELGDAFNHPILPGMLPNSLESLRLPNAFNKSLKLKSLPDSLKYFYTGKKFNQSLLPGVLPKNLLGIGFGDNFNKYLLPNVLPSKLDEIQFGNKYEHFLSYNVIPQSLRTIYLDREFMIDSKIYEQVEIIS
jgi:hypothetical protein